MEAFPSGSRIRRILRASKEIWSRGRANWSDWKQGGTHNKQISTGINRKRRENSVVLLNGIRSQWETSMWQDIGSFQKGPDIWKCLVCFFCYLVLKWQSLRFRPDGTAKPKSIRDELWMSDRGPCLRGLQLLTTARCLRASEEKVTTWNSNGPRSKPPLWSWLIGLVSGRLWQPNMAST